MSFVSDVQEGVLQQVEPPRDGTARQQLDHLYRAIGISAVAAAAAQISRKVPKPEAARHEMPACLRDDNDVAA